jgi:hypothetical protein
MVNRGALASVVLVAGALAACSSSGGSGPVSSSGNYCSDLKSTAAYFKALSDMHAGGIDFAKVQSSFKTLGDEAPSSLKSDWSQLNAGVSQILSALSKAGLKPSDLENAQSLPPDKLQKLEQVGKTLEGETGKLDAASMHIESDAKTRCHVTLSS